MNQQKKTVEEMISQSVVHDYLMEEGYDGTEAFTTADLEDVLVTALESFAPKIYTEGVEEGGRLEKKKVLEWAIHMINLDPSTAKSKFEKYLKINEKNLTPPNENRED